MAARSQDCSGSVQKENDNYDEMADDETAEDDNEEAPVVLQCKNCNTIVGDSMAWVCANDDIKAVTLHSITNAVQTGKKLMTSTTEGIDLGSTYVHLLCKQCNEVVGRIYKTTSRQLDNLRDLYTFPVHQITSYQVGSRDQTAGAWLQDLVDLPTAKSLKDSIVKTQVMICALNNRILNIENSLEIKDDQEDLDQDHTAVGPSAAPYKTPDDQYNATVGMSDPAMTRKQPASQQDKTVPPQTDGGLAGRDTSGSAANGRQYTAGKRSKEPLAVTGSRSSKRSRFK